MNAGISFKLQSRKGRADMKQVDAIIARELSSLRKSNDRLAADNKSLEEKNLAQAKRIEMLEADTAKAKADNAKEMADLKAATVTLQTDSAKELAALKANNAMMRVNHEKVKADYEAQVNVAHAQAKELAALRADNAKMKADNEKSKADNVARAKEMAALRADNAKMKMQIEKILSELGDWESEEESGAEVTATMKRK